MAQHQFIENSNTTLKLKAIDKLPIERVITPNTEKTGENTLLRKILHLLALFYLFACATPLWEDQLRNASRNESPINAVPQFTLLNDISWQARQVASKTPKKHSKQKRHSNKSIYFQTLFKQFQKFKAFHPGLTKSIRYCPSFHSTFLALKESSSPSEATGEQGTAALTINRLKLQELISLKKEREVLALFPEMALPTAHGDLRNDSPTTVYHALQKQSGKDFKDTLYRGLQIHTEKTYRELQQLCNFGHGKNYFIFENMVTYTQKNPHFKNGPQALLSLLKTTVFANYTLLRSLQLHQGPADMAPPSETEQEMLSRLNAHWSSQYFHQFQQRRLALL